METENVPPPSANVAHLHDLYGGHSHLESAKKAPVASVGLERTSFSTNHATDFVAMSTANELQAAIVKSVQEYAKLPTLQRLAEETFGTAAERSAHDGLVVKRILPNGYVQGSNYGFTREFHNSECNRICNGFRKLALQRDSFLSAVVDDVERRREAVLKDLERNGLRAAEKVIELLRKIEEVEGRLAVAKRQAGFAKGQALKGEELTARATLAEEEARSAAQAAELKLSNMEVREAESRRRAEQAESEVLSLGQELREAQEQLQLLQEISAKNEQERRALYDAESRALTERLQVVSAQHDQLKVSLSQCEGKLAQAEREARDALLASRKTEELVQVMKIRAEAAESKLESKDTNMEKALQALGANQAFNNERIETLGRDKARLEMRVEELQAEKSGLATKLAEMTAFTDHSKEKIQELSERLEAAKLEIATLTTKCDEARTEAAAKSAKWTEARDQVERATEQAQQERKALEATTLSLRKSEERAERLEVELRANQAALDSIKTASPTSAQSGPADPHVITRYIERASTETTSEHHRQELERLQQELAATKQRLVAAETARRVLHDEIQNLKGNVRVVARIRPANKPTDANMLTCSMDGATLNLDLAPEQTRHNRAESHSFSFNRAFPPGTTQIAIFDEVSSFVQSALDGYHVCLFSYGQTGSGKTYTMMGGDPTVDSQRGIVPRSTDQIFRTATELRESGWEFEIECTFVEIYNEQIRDLLALDARAERAAKHEISHRGDGQIVVGGIRRVRVEDPEHVHNLVQYAESNRAVAKTDKNSESSRSHSVFTMSFVGRNKRNARPGVPAETLIGSLNLCDLAGSERLKSSHAQGETLKETQAINTSLSALATVFTAIQQKAGHIPYRNSTLTHMLSPCLSGEGKTLMIVNLSADQDDAGETLCSLRFAQTVNKTEVGKAKKNIVGGGAPAAAAGRPGLAAARR